MENIGLLGGTFDPIHDGHLQLADAARIEACLDKVLLLPAAGPPHKSQEEVTPFHHRKRMLELALKGVEYFEPCFIEEKLPVPSYTIDTMRYLLSRDDGTVNYSFIIGIDAFADLLSWKEYRQLLTLVHLIVARRKGFHRKSALDMIMVQLGYCSNPAGTRWEAKSGLKDIFFLDSQPDDISSSRIRSKLRSGAREVSGLCPEVLQYIQRNGLYR
mgnify:CR=1 FL=1